jgi:predicted metal-binding membrane protein
MTSTTGTKRRRGETVNVVRTTDARPPSARGLSAPLSRRVFFGISALLFVASAALTAIVCLSMSAAGEMPRPGGWSMSMAWRRMCGQTWPRAAASFIGMWVVMMVAMMLPSLAPMLWRYHETVGRLGHAHAGRLSAWVGVGYFFVWTSLGAAVFPPGAALAAFEMQWPALARAVPVALGAVVLVAGMLQFSDWKARHLACCRHAFDCARARAWPADMGAAWRYGVRQGLHCVCCCAGLTAVLLAAGVMDLRVMTAVTAAVTAERLAPNGERVARVIGAAVVGIGLLMLARVLPLS